MISINILTWNNASTIIDLMNAAKKEVEFLEHEFIFVDNGSTDGTSDLISKWISDNVKDNFTYIRNSENRGISVGKNQGINNSNGDYIMMLDGDIVPVDNSIRLMVDWMEKNVDKVAIGMYPNKFTISKDMAVKHCDELVNIKEHPCACLFYGIYRRKIFDDGLRLSEEGEFGKPGYGWEDHDFFKRFTSAGHIQYVAMINNNTGLYYHKINSSIRAMGREKYVDTSRARGKQFHEVWDAT